MVFTKRCLAKSLLLKAFIKILFAEVMGTLLGKRIEGD